MAPKLVHSIVYPGSSLNCPQRSRSKQNALSVSVEEQKALLQGLQWLTPKETIDAFQPGNTTKSVIYAGEIVANFMVDQKLLTRKPASTADLIDERFMKTYIAKAT